MGGNSSKETQPHQARSNFTMVQQNKFNGVKMQYTEGLRVNIGKWSTFKMNDQGEYWRLLLPAPRSYLVQATSYSASNHLEYLLCM